MVFCAGGVRPALGQDKGIKGIDADEFIMKRPRKPPGTGTMVRKKPTYSSYEAVRSAAPPKGKVFADVGVTIWRFRPSKPIDKTKELVEIEGAQNSEWTLERVREGTLLAPGQVVRLTVESLSREGYLYVISREAYADGSLGDPRLIFPGKSTPAGGNFVKAGKMIYVPGPPRYFLIKPSRSAKRHIAETLTLLVSSQPLIDPALSATPITSEQVELWESQWATRTTRFEMEQGAGQSMTEEEQNAATDNANLTQEDPTPQTIYRLAIKSDDAVVIRVPLRFTQSKVGNLTNSKP